MSSKAAVDSNAYIALCSGDTAVATLLGSYQAVCLPVVVLAELLYGAAASGRAADNRRKVEAFARKCTLIELSAAIAEQYAELKFRLRTAGKPIPDNDLWIAAACIIEGVPLITRDGHFSHVPTLQVLSW